MNTYTDLGNKKVSSYMRQIRDARKRNNRKTTKKVNKFELKKLEHISSSLIKKDSNYKSKNEINMTCTKYNLEAKTKKYRRLYFEKIMNSSVKMLFVDLKRKSKKVIRKRVFIGPKGCNRNMEGAIEGLLLGSSNWVLTLK